MLTFGIDTHKKFAQIAVLNDEGIFQMDTKLLNKKEAFQKFFNNFDEPCQAVIESGYSWGIIYDILTELGVDVKVAHALKVKAIASAKIKTDKIDARTLAQLLRANLIPEVHVPTASVRHQKNILRQRCWFVKIKTMAKNRIHQILDRNHVETPGFNDLFGMGGRRFLDSLTLSHPDQDILRQDLELLDFIIKQVKRTEKWIEESLKDNVYRKIIQTTPGFGKLLSALVALEIDDIHRFSYPGKLSAYAGLVPSTYASGGNVSHGRLMSNCNHWLRYAFVEAAWAAIRSSPYFRALFSRIKKRKGPNIAIAVIARRLSEVVYRCLWENRNYEERPYNAPQRNAA